MSSSKNKFKLDEFEKEIEKHAEEFVPIPPKTRKKIEKIIKKAKKTRNVNLRMADYVLEELKLKASLEAIPYQSYINSILHRYVTGQLVDRSRVIELLTIKKALEEKDLS
jgi:predicted DNA binding CopG/RHH family protein